MISRIQATGTLMNNSAINRINSVKNNKNPEKDLVVQSTSKGAESSNQEKVSGEGKSSLRNFDVYEKSFKHPTPASGIYKVSTDENGVRQISFDRVNDDKSTDKSEPAKSTNTGKSADTEKTTANTDKVDKEIKALKEQEKKLKSEIKDTTFSQPDKLLDLQSRLRQVQNELRLKDNDTYRKIHAEYSTEIGGTLS